jgi:hypothetical protein
MNKYFLFIVAISFSCCSNIKKHPEMKEALTGNWLVLYPDEHTKDKTQRVLYAMAQDSIVELMGLKLLTFNADGGFQLTDSLFRKKGKWQLNGNELHVTDGGKGWQDFQGKLVGFSNDTIQIVEYITLKNEPIRVVWFMKKINSGDEGADLFEKENNRWREKPGKPESTAVIKNKLKKILEYYSNYYQLVSKEAIYFTGSRVALPFRYYQHGTGLMRFNENDAFSKLFYDSTDARNAYRLLADVFSKSKNKEFPSGDNFVVEYAEFMQGLAYRIE